MRVKSSYFVSNKQKNIYLDRMKKIGLLSDTHGYIDDKMLSYFEKCDEIWHAGDIGTTDVSIKIESFKPYKAVFGNIDGHELRVMHPEYMRFTCEGVDVFMTHIGGYPGKYTKRMREYLKKTAPPKLYICGHSHILKVMHDKKKQTLHINPGAAGNHGFHKMRTMVRFDLNEGRIENLEVIELGKR